MTPPLSLLASLRKSMGFALCADRQHNLLDSSRHELAEALEHLALSLSRLQALGLCEGDLHTLLAHNFGAGGADALLDRALDLLDHQQEPTAAELRLAQPRWEAKQRRLYLGRVLVKQFRLVPENQGLVLSAFEEQGWPERIDDPLSQTTHVPPVVRLHDTIKCLNRGQGRPLLRFRGDGTGQGVRWERFGEAAEPGNAS